MHPHKKTTGTCLYQELPVIFLEDIANKLIFQNSPETRGKVMLIRCYNNTVSKDKESLCKSFKSSNRLKM